MKLYCKESFFANFCKRFLRFLKKNEILRKKNPQYKVIQKKGNDIVHFFLPICSVFGRLFKSFSICLESVESLQDFTLFPETWASSRIRPSEIVNSVEESGKDVIPMAISPKVKIETKVKNSVTCIVTLSVCPLVRLSICLFLFLFSLFLRNEQM